MHFKAKQQKNESFGQLSEHHHEDFQDQRRHQWPDSANGREDEP